MNDESASTIVARSIFEAEYAAATKALLQEIAMGKFDELHPRFSRGHSVVCKGKPAMVVAVLNKEDLDPAFHQYRVSYIDGTEENVKGSDMKPAKLPARPAPRGSKSGPVLP